MNEERTYTIAEILAKLDRPISDACEYCCRWPEKAKDYEDDKAYLEEQCASCPLIWMEFTNRVLKPTKYEWLPYPENVPTEPGRYLVKYGGHCVDPGDEEDTLFFTGTDWRLYSYSKQSIGTVAAWTRYPKCPESISGN